MNLDRRRTTTTASSGPGWLATAGGALLLIALGFGVGIVAGTAYQEPELVVDHLAGRSTEVVLAPDGALGDTPDGAPGDALDEAPGDTPDVAAPAPPLGEGGLAQPVAAAQPAPAPAPLARATRPAAPAPAPKAARGAGFSIQVGAFASEKAARQLASELGRHGYSAYLTDEGSGARWKVRVGPLDTRREAEALSARLKREQRLPTWIQANG